MLDHIPTPLAHHLATITAELRAQANRATTDAGPIAALHALILAALARLFNGLTELFSLWQAGQLAPALPAHNGATTSRNHNHPRAATPHHRHAAARPAARHSNALAPTAAPIRRHSAPAKRALNPSRRTAARRGSGISPASPNRPSPHPGFLSNDTMRATLMHVYFITLSKR